MHENFIALDLEKRDRIINAAMAEFSEKGYKNASTNKIVKKAGISKGALFHYFSSKRDLFAFLFRYSIDFYIKLTEPRIPDLPSDVFERWMAWALLKIEISAQYPAMSDFLQKTYRENAGETGSLMQKEYERFIAAFQKSFYDGIDLSKFRQDTDVSQALKVIWWVVEGFARSKQDEALSLSSRETGPYVRSLLGEVEGYLSVLKRSFYKEEYL